MRIFALFSLLVAFALAPAALPALAQQATMKNVKEKFDASKRTAEDLLKRSGEIIKLIKGADEKAVEANFNEAISLVEQAIKTYDEGSPLWKALDELDGINRKNLEDAQKETSAEGRQLVDRVRKQQENAVRQRTELKKQLLDAHRDLEFMKQNKRLLMLKIRIDGVDAAQELIERSLKDFASLSENMKDMMPTPSKALPGSGT